VYHVADINANRNVSGGGINIAQRVMDCGDAGHILVSSAEADVLTQVGTWCRMLHDLGDVEVKHGTRIHLYNLYTEQAGSAELPKKISASKDKAVATGVAEKRAVAVLPFRLLTPNAEDAYLSLALADAVIHQLGAGGEILVRPTSAVERYAQAVDPLQVARELHVQIVAQGGIQKSGTQLRVHVQAWNAADGRVIHSAKYDTQIHELFSLQDQLAVDLGRALGVWRTAENKTHARRAAHEECPCV
jgi:TolB-like protein